MIVNTNLNQSGVMDPPQCENYLKRKLGHDDQIDTDSHFYVQPKKRHIQCFSTSSNNLLSIENCNELSFNLNNNTFINDFFNYDENLIPTSASSIVHAATAYSTEHLDASWQSSDLLELDHRYNSSVMDNQSPGHQHHHMSEYDKTEKEKTKNDQISNFTNNSEPETDFEDKNLSWLFNFKLDELPHLSPEVNRSPQAVTKSHPHSQQSSSPISSKGGSKVNSKTLRKFEELVMEATSPEMDANDMVVAENIIVENNSMRMPKKPPFTYTELIEYALEDKGELTVSGIYQWISDRFPFYKSNDDRWKNSVRHNLSINPHFRKGAKAPQGAGHLWTISSGDSEENVLAWEHKKQRLELFFKMETMHREKETTTTTSSSHSDQQHIYDEAAAAVAIIAQEMRNHSPETSQCPPMPINDRLPSISSELPFNDLINEDDLRRSAGEILNGIRRDVEVQAINSIISTYHDSLLDSEDYLNPINKDVVVTESGLRNDSSYYVTEIDPITLGINMNNVEEEVLFSDEFNLNYFGITSGSDIVA